jgi:hypothetical protein
MNCKELCKTVSQGQEVITKAQGMQDKFDAHHGSWQYSHNHSHKVDRRRDRQMLLNLRDRLHRDRKLEVVEYTELIIFRRSRFHRRRSEI